LVLMVLKILVAPIRVIRGDKAVEKDGDHCFGAPHLLLRSFNIINIDVAIRMIFTNGADLIRQAGAAVYA